MATAASNRWAMVEEVYDTGELETVYNFTVEEYHTYYVGRPDWGFSVWAHNEGGARGRAKTETRTTKTP
jgi:hypothetical protein